MQPDSLKINDTNTEISGLSEGKYCINISVVNNCVVLPYVSSTIESNADNKEFYRKL